MRTKTFNVFGKNVEATLLAGGFGAKIYGFNSHLIVVVDKKEFVILNTHQHFKLVIKFVNLKYQPANEKEKLSEDFKNFVTTLKEWKKIKKEQNPIAFPFARNKVSGLTVTANIPNQGSIKASFDKYQILNGVRELNFSEFDCDFVATDRTKKLAADIKASGVIDPLIVVCDSEGLYILEGAHRFDALLILGKESFPALIVFDNDRKKEKNPKRKYTFEQYDEIAKEYEQGTAKLEEVAKKYGIAPSSLLKIFTLRNIKHNRLSKREQKLVNKNKKYDKKPSAKKDARRKVSEEQYDKILEEYSQGTAIDELAKKYGISTHYIYLLKLRKDKVEGRLSPRKQRANERRELIKILSSGYKEGKLSREEIIKNYNISETVFNDEIADRDNLSILQIKQIIFGLSNEDKIKTKEDATKALQELKGFTKSLEQKWQEAKDEHLKDTIKEKIFSLIEYTKKIKKMFPDVEWFKYTSRDNSGYGAKNKEIEQAVITAHVKGFTIADINQKLLTMGIKSTTSLVREILAENKSLVEAMEREELDAQSKKLKIKNPQFKKMSYKDLIKEHKNLVKILKSGDKKAISKEMIEQEKELRRYILESRKK